MKKMYEEYKDIVEFRIVYIKEAHPVEGDKGVRYAKEKGITQPKTYEERCTVADILMKEQEIKIPTIIDEIDNKVGEAYRGSPTRAFLARKDGRLGVAGKRGPWGLKPALEQIKECLEQYRKTGEEPEISKEQKTEYTEAKPDANEK